MPENPGVTTGTGSPVSFSTPAPGEVSVVHTPGTVGIAANDAPPLIEAVNLVITSQNAAARLATLGMPSRTGVPTTTNPLASLTRLVELFSPTRGSLPYYVLQETLLQLGHPTELNGRRITFTTHGGENITLLQRGSNDPINVNITPAATSSLRTRLYPGYRPFSAITLRYFPDERVAKITDRPKRATSAQSYYSVHELPGELRSSQGFLLQNLKGQVESHEKAALAYERLHGSLEQIKPTRIEGYTRWYSGIIGFEGRLYNIGLVSSAFASTGLSQDHPQLLLQEMDRQGHREVLRLAANGELNPHLEKIGKQVPNPDQFSLLNGLHSQAQGALKDPIRHQKDLKRAYRYTFGAGHELAIPTVEKLTLPNLTSSQARGPHGEAIITIRNGWDLIRFVPPYIGHPTRVEVDGKVRYLRPRLPICFAMGLEAWGWGWGQFNGYLSYSRGHTVENHNAVTLSLYPDGRQRLAISRGDVLHNIITLGPEGTQNLAKHVKVMQRADPSLRGLPRAELLDRAIKSIESGVVEKRNTFLIQDIPHIPIHELEKLAGSNYRQTFSSSLTTAHGAWELIQNLPGMQGIQAHVRVGISNMEAALSKGRVDRLAHETLTSGNQNSLEVSFPNAHRPTRILISEKGNGRLVIECFQGNDVARAVYEQGQYRPHESARLNHATLHQASQGYHKHHWVNSMLRPLVRGYAYLSANGRSYFVGHFASLPFIYGIERFMFNPKERQLIGTPLPDLSWSALGQETINVAALTLGSGLGTMAVDGAFNYVGGLGEVYKTWRSGSGSLGSALGYHKPHLLNTIPLLSRPIPRTALYTRNFLQRSVPLLGGLMAVDMMERGSFVPQLDERTLGMAMRIGAVSALTSGFLALGQNRLETFVARGIEPTGIFGRLHRWGFFREAGKSAIGRSSYVTTFRCTFSTITLELIALKLWDTYDRKDLLADQETQLRKGIAFAMDQYNRMLSQVALGEDIPITRLQEAEQEVKQTHRRYASYLKIMERTSGDGEFRALDLSNSYEPKPFADITHSPLSFAERVELSQQDQSLKERKEQIYAMQGLASPKQNPQEESLYNFLKRIDKEVEAATSNPNPAEEIGEQTSLPFALHSSQGKRMAEFLSEQLNHSTNFWQKGLEAQAKILVREFSGFTATDDEGNLRSWSETDAKRMLLALLEENERLLNEMETPLIKPRGDVNRMVMQWEKIAKAEEEIFTTYEKGNPHFIEKTTKLAGNQEDLSLQMEAYLDDANQKFAQAIEQFLAHHPEKEKNLSAMKIPQTYQFNEEEDLKIGPTSSERSL